MFNILSNMAKDFNKFMHAVRTLEISYEVEDDRYNKPIVKEINKDEEKAKNVALSIDFYSATNKLKEKNFAKNIKIIENKLKKEYEKQGLLPTQRQIEYEALQHWNFLLETGQIDELNCFNEAYNKVLDL